MNSIDYSKYKFSGESYEETKKNFYERALAILIALSIVSTALGCSEKKKTDNSGTAIALLALSSNAQTVATNVEPDQYTIASTVTGNGITLDNAAVSFTASPTASVLERQTTTSSATNAVIGTNGSLNFDCPAGRFSGSGRTTAGQTFSFTLTVTVTGSTATGAFSGYSTNISGVTVASVTKRPPKPSLPAKVSSCKMTQAVDF